jgi:flavin-dependent dehydrogenase
MYDCIVVGAGPSGGSASYHLAKLGRSVLLLEKEPAPIQALWRWCLAYGSKMV